MRKSKINYFLIFSIAVLNTGFAETTPPKPSKSSFIKSHSISSTQTSETTATYTITDNNNDRSKTIYVSKSGNNEVTLNDTATGRTLTVSEGKVTLSGLGANFTATESSKGVWAVQGKQINGTLTTGSSPDTDPTTFTGTTTSGKTVSIVFAPFNEGGGITVNGEFLGQNQRTEVENYMQLYSAVSTGQITGQYAKDALKGVIVVVGVVLVVAWLA